MTKKEAFILEVEDALEHISFSEDALAFFEELKNDKVEKKKVTITEKGLQILLFMKDNEEKYNNTFTSKDIAEGLDKSSRSISGSMKKLIDEDFVTKTGSDPIVYSITEKGKAIE